MDNPLVIAIGISVIGMTLLFLALVLFYGLLSLMMTVLEDRSPKPETQASEEQVVTKDSRVLQAAAIAVALARARDEHKSPPAPTPEGDTGNSESASPWWSLHHQREITRNPKVGRVP